MKKPRGVRIAGNWKMNHGLKAAEAFFVELGKLTSSRVPAAMADAMTKGRLRATIFPQALALETASRVAAQLRQLPIEIGVQNAHGEKSGAFTGENSAALLEELGARAALGMADERRQVFGESDQLVTRRLEGLLPQGIDVIACLGETRAEREGGKTEHILDRQLAALLSSAVLPYCNGRLTLAYEPVWAIGTGLTATPEQAEAAQAFLRSQLKARGAQAAETTPILYGGSVTPENVASLLACPNVDGCLVGGASLKPESYLKLLTAGFEAL
jgi:triosephosphate isomerase (TIM)